MQSISTTRTTPPATAGQARDRRAGSRLVARLKSDRGAITAEYAIATMAAVAFAGLLVLIMRSDEVRAILFNLVSSALSVDI
jgi:hypothetical protein